MKIELLYILGAIASVITALPLLFAFLKKCLEICKIAIKLFHTAIKSFFTKNIDAIRAGGFFGVFLVTSILGVCDRNRWILLAE